MSHIIPPDPRDERRLRAALAVFRKWRADAIRRHAQTTDPEWKRVYAQRRDDAEYLAYRVEQLLHPAGPTDEEGSDES